MLKKCFVVLFLACVVLTGCNNSFDKPKDTLSKEERTRLEALKIELQKNPTPKSQLPIEDQRIIEKANEVIIGDSEPWDSEVKRR